MQGALHRGQAGPNEQAVGLLGAVQLPMPPQQQKQVWQEGLKPLRR
jgi:hypothetical protein